MARRSHLGLLWLLYFAQGLPFGFQATALPVLLREGRASLTLISLTGLVAAPWVLKPLWAPWVDRSSQRKRWLLPTQGLLALSVAGAGLVHETNLWGLLAAVLVINLFAATLDIAVDGLAVDVLATEELGVGNAAQVVGYKLGMIVGGGLLLYASSHVGHREGMFGMAGLILAVLAVTWRFDEPPRAARARQPVSYGGAMKRLWATFRAPQTRWVAIAAISYKAGEAMADTMFKPFVVDAGFTRDQIGLWIGTWGMAFSLVGSLSGGWLASRWPIMRALAVCAVLRVLPLVGQIWLATSASVDADALIAITCAEHLLGGALTTTMFAMMMSAVDREIGATHFTALAALEVIGKGACGMASGPITEQLGYVTTFSVAVFLSIAFLLVLPRLRAGR